MKITQYLIKKQKIDANKIVEEKFTDSEELRDERGEARERGVGF